MSAVLFDPYLRQYRLHWRNRVQRWQAAPAQTVFHGLAVLAGLAVLVLIVHKALPAARSTLSLWVAKYPLELAVGLGLVAGWQHHALLRRLQRRMASDWLAAQPVAEALLQRWRRLQAGRLLTLQVTALLIVVGLAKLSAAAALGATAAVVLGTSGGLALGRRTGRRHLRPARRETLWQSTRPGRIWRWQWIEAGASLAPRRLAWMLLAILLVPRGGLAMGLVALVLVGLTTLANAWQRALGVLPLAEAWLAAQPLPARRWLLQAVPVPLLILASACAPLWALATGQGSAPLQWLAAGALPALAILQWSVVAACRRRPARIGPVFAVHAVLLIAVFQSLPPLAPLLWLLQTGSLIRRACK